MLNYKFSIKTTISSYTSAIAHMRVIFSADLSLLYWYPHSCKKKKVECGFFCSYARQRQYKWVKKPLKRRYHILVQKHNPSGCNLSLFEVWFILKDAVNLLVFWCGFFGPFSWGKTGYMVGVKGLSLVLWLRYINTTLSTVSWVCLRFGSFLKTL